MRTGKLSFTTVYLTGKATGFRLACRQTPKFGDMKRLLQRYNKLKQGNETLSMNFAH